VFKSPKKKDFCLLTFDLRVVALGVEKQIGMSVVEQDHPGCGFSQPQKENYGS
jgi:hypothetical protein